MDVLDLAGEHLVGTCTDGTDHGALDVHWAILQDRGVHLQSIADLMYGFDNTTKAEVATKRYHDSAYDKTIVIDDNDYMWVWAR